MIITTSNINEFVFANDKGYAADIFEDSKNNEYDEKIACGFRSYKLADTNIDKIPLKEWLSKNYPNGICQEELGAILQKQAGYDEFFSIYYDDWKEIVDSTIEKVRENL